jgi:hypothetical protein
MRGDGVAVAPSSVGGALADLDLLEVFQQKGLRRPKPLA